MKYIYITLICVSLVLACKHNSTSEKLLAKGILQNGQEYKIYSVSSDPVIDKVVKIYYQNSDLLYEAYGLKNNQKEGFDEIHSHSGVLKKRIIWSKDRLKKTITFDEEGDLKEIDNYVSLNAIDTLNTYFSFTKNGDTAKEESFYYSIYGLDDSVKYGNDYTFRIQLESHIYDQAYVSFCGYDDNFNEHPSLTTGKCDSFPMDDFKLIVTKKGGYNLGKNMVSGEIINFGKKK